MSGPGSAAAGALETLAGRGQSLAVAESLTGGLVAGALTAVPGASRVVRGSVTAYATEVKRELLGVDGALLAARGAVDGEVARQMASGARRVLGADWGLATTGVAAPILRTGIRWAPFSWRSRGRTVPERCGGCHWREIVTGSARTPFAPCSHCC